MSVEQDDHYILSGYSMYIVLIFLLIFMIGIVMSNGFVVLLILSRKRLRTIPNFYIVALSSAQFLVGTFVVSSTAIGTLNPETSVAWCAAVPFLELFAFSSGIFYLVGLTVDRYASILDPMNYKPTIRGTLLKILVMTSAALIYSLHVIVQHFLTDLNSNPNTNTSDEQNENMCSILTEDESSDFWFRVGDFVFLFIFPIAIMIVMYTKIVKKLWAKTATQTTSIKKKRRAVRSTVACVISFFICWFPFHIMDIFHDGFELMDVEEIDPDVYDVIRFVVIFLALSNSIINPILYGFLHRNFQLEVILLKQSFKRNKIDPKNENVRQERGQHEQHGNENIESQTKEQHKPSSTTGIIDT